jgi:hypothetical protein
VVLLLGLGQNRRLDLGPCVPLGVTITGTVLLGFADGTKVAVSGPQAAKLAEILGEITPEGEESQRVPRGAELYEADIERRQQAALQADAT